MKDLLRHITSNKNVRVGIESLLINKLITKYETAIAHVKFFLKVELEGTQQHYITISMTPLRSDIYLSK